ncbi:hypothetical protein JA1_001359 [Spathaspora sp. JA1]|nr:hypothetical protein JA1_001359 [Spathaspora sp. JA1]
MPNIIQSIRNLTSPATESKIKNATNTEPLGPFNHELIELSCLTFNKKDLSVIISGIIKRLNPLLKIAANKKQQPIHQSTSIDENPPPRKRSGSLTTLLPSLHFKQESTPSQRSDTFPSPDGKYNHNSNMDEKTNLSLLKTCAVILYLLQNGSDSFIEWMQREYHVYITPLLKLSFPPKYHVTLRHKLGKIIQLMESPVDLQVKRNNIHKLRADLLVPGVKRSSLDIDLLHVQEQQSPIRYRRYSYDQDYTSAPSPPRSIAMAPESTMQGSQSPRSSPPQWPRRAYSVQDTFVPTHPDQPAISPRTPNPHRLSSIF